jgi:hypothetical protein
MSTIGSLWSNALLAASRDARDAWNGEGWNGDARDAWNGEAEGPWSFMPDGSSAANRREPPRFAPASLRTTREPALFPDSFRALTTKQQQQEQTPDAAAAAAEAEDFVFDIRRNPLGAWEHYCVTCSAWCGDDLQDNGHVMSSRHKNAAVYFETQRTIAAQRTTKEEEASVGSPTRRCCAPPKRGARTDEAPEYVTHEDMEIGFEKIRIAGRFAEELHEDGLNKFLVQLQKERQQQQKELIEQLQKEQKQLQKEQKQLQKQQLIEQQKNATLAAQLLDLKRTSQHMSHAIEQVQDYLSSEEA